MSYQTLIGAKFFVSTGLEAAKPITAISNAAPPVVTSNAHGYANGDELLILNGWEDFNESVIRASAVAANAYTIADYDSQNTDFFPAAGAAGNAQKISGWLPVGQVLGITPSGGEAAFEDLKPLDRRNGIKLFNGFTGASLEFMLGWDRSLNEQKAFQAASRVGGKRAIKFLLPGSVYAYAYGTISASNLPQFESVLKQKVVMTVAGMFTSFI